MSYMSSPSSPAARRRRFSSSLAIRACAFLSTSAASSRRTMQTPSSSPTTTSPGSTGAPAQTTGTLTEPGVFFTVPWAHTALDQTGKHMAVRSLTSRTPVSATSPAAPRARAEVASRSPK